MDAATLLLHLFCSLFSAVICQQALENKRGRQGMRREITGVTFTVRRDIKVWTQHGNSSQSVARRNHRDPSREYARTSSTFLNFHHFRPQVQSESYQFKQYWLLNYHHMGDFTPTRAGNYSFTDPTTTQTAAD